MSLQPRNWSQTLLHMLAVIGLSYIQHSQVLDLYEIKCIELHSKIPVKNGQFTLNTFHKSTCKNGPCMLILSNISMVGLNLACTNILIMMVKMARVTGSKRKAMKQKIWKYPLNNAIEENTGNTNSKGKGKASNNNMEVDPPPSTTAAGREKTAPPTPNRSTPALTPAVPDMSTSAAIAPATASMHSPPHLEEDPILAAATLDPSYWKDPYEIKAKGYLSFENEPPLLPLLSLMSPTPEPTPRPKLVPPPARHAVHNSGPNNICDNSLQFGPWSSNNL
ncbi:hypothetical protein OG21DRAFT_1523142 [Imleria badia]|nr:hypothetical protein OG21DRAFT_1523142 [Imleria badia]